MLFSLRKPSMMHSERVQRHVNRLLDEAEEALRQRDWATVSDRVEIVLALDPDNEDGRALLGAASEASGADRSRTEPAQEHAASRPQPAPVLFNDKRYTVKKILGEGASKRVYLVQDMLLDREVAFAVIRTEGLDEASRHRILREAQAMAKLGDHSNIVPLHDFGDEEGQLYMVLPVMRGGDVQTLIRNAPEHRLAREQAAQIAMDTCRGLDFAHSNGIVHRDLKPGNIWLTSDGTAKIGDFGLSISLDHARITQGEVTMGTLLYMSPEQSIGGEITGRSDLYSLGCLLYEMVTGEPPFLGENPKTIIGQHLNTPPVSPAWRNPEVTPELDALILQLLEKNPAKRPTSAAQVCETLMSINLGPVRSDWSEQEASRVAAAQRPIYRSTFVGREADLKQLHTAFDGALSGQGSLVMVVGEPGVGKTALCEQLGTYVALRGGLTLEGRCYQEGFPSLPYLPFVEALSSYVASRSTEDLKKQLGAGPLDVGKIVPEVHERLGVLPIPPGDPTEDRYRLMQAVVSFLRSATTIQPLLIVLDDLHDADKGTLDMLNYISRGLSSTRLLIVGTYRDIEVDRGHPLSETLMELRRASSVSRIVLRGISVDEVQRMMSSIAVRELSWGLAEAVHQQTEGNPFFVQEVLRYLVEEGLLEREDRRSTGQLPLSIAIPEGLTDVIGKRLSQLGPVCNRLLRTAAVIGQQIRLDLLQRVAELPDDKLFTALEEAKKVKVLEERTSVGGVVNFNFTHSFFRQMLYEENIAPRRILLHQKIGRAMEEVYSDHVEDHVTELAGHFANSSDPADLAKALDYTEMAARRATSVYAHVDAVRLLEQSIQVHEVLDPAGSEKRCDLLVALGEALMSAGEPRHAFENVAPEALELARSLGDQRRASVACQLALTSLMRYGSGTMMGTPLYQEWAERADRYAEADTVERVHADGAMSIVRFAQKRTTESTALAEQSMELAWKLEDPETLFSAALGILSRPQVPQHMEGQMRLAREFAHRTHEGVSGRTLGLVLHLCGFALLAQGDRDRAERLWGEVEQLASRTQDPDLVLLSLSPNPPKDVLGDSP